MHSRRVSLAWRLALAIALAILVSQSVLAQTFTVLHNFTGGHDGNGPIAGLTMAGVGNLYGTAAAGGEYDYGVVFRLTHKGSGWTFTPLYSFQGGNDGAEPLARVIVGPNGSLYGTTNRGGGNYCDSSGCGTVFNVRPPARASTNVLGGWAETVLYRFTGHSDGANPSFGDVAFDQAGNIYGTTQYTDEGGSGYGVVYELTPSNGSWTQSVAYSFMGGNDAWNPISGVVVDKAGNLYGTTIFGGIYGWGTVYELTPSGSGWIEKILYSFTGGNDGANPYADLIFDSAGNLYGVAAQFGSGNGGTVFELMPSGGDWTFSLLYSFDGSGGSDARLAMDATGNLYGTTQSSAGGYGSVFELTAGSGGWTYTLLHNFTGPDGGGPHGGVILDADGNLYGTAPNGGAYGYGVVWEITP